jgi:hypothetical protein
LRRRALAITAIAGADKMAVLLLENRLQARQGPHPVSPSKRGRWPKKGELGASLG